MNLLYTVAADWGEDYVTVKIFDDPHYEVNKGQIIYLANEFVITLEQTCVLVLVASHPDDVLSVELEQQKFVWSEKVGLQT